MNLDDIKDKIATHFKWTEIETEMYSGDIEKLSARHNGENEHILQAILRYCDKVKKSNFTDFMKNSSKWISVVNREEKTTYYSNPEVAYIVETMLDGMEYRLQEYMKNTELTTRKNRLNYIRIDKLQAAAMTEPLKSFVIGTNGSIEIVAEHQTLFFDQIAGILQEWSGKISIGVQARIRAIGIKEFITIYLVNYFWDMLKWTENILVPLSEEFETKIILKTNNDMRESLKICFDTINKLELAKK
jgi:hypothetical protein